MENSSELFQISYKDLQAMKKVKVEGELVFMDPIAKKTIKDASHFKDVELDFAGVCSIDSSGVDLI